MKRSRLRAKGWQIGLGACIGLVASQGGALAQGTAGDAAHPISQGQYLATAADCAACHTAQNGKPFAGGYAIASPLGVIVSSNITPSKTAGIGNYSQADFARAVRDGVRPDGTHLYPAMPYTSYAGLSDQDVAALYAYFMQQVPAVDTTPQKTALPFPFSIRASMVLWNLLFLDHKPFTLDAAKTAEVNRGAYLVDNLEHCAACHTPRNILMASEGGKDLSGGSLGSWYAPNITSDPVSGIGRWSEDELVQYLRTGSVPGKAQAAGPMAEAVSNSLQYLTGSDLHAVAAYLKQSAPISTGSTSRTSFGAPVDAEAAVRGLPVQETSGAQIYSGTCASCHGDNGAGNARHDYPSLFHNTATGAQQPANLISTIVFGVQRISGGQETLMPSFGPGSTVNALSDQEIADVSNYVLQHFGDASVTVTAQDVQTVREGGAPSTLAQLGPLAAPGLAAIVVVVVLLVLALVWRSRRHRVAA
jgi:mono/diheme cytochrome c family protein